jgi:hypothetical protein
MTGTTQRARRAAGSFGLMTDERDPHDLYETPEDAVHMLVRNLWAPGYELSVWDPSCGRGAILMALMTQDHCPIENIVGTDKHSYTPLDSRLRHHLIYNRPFEDHLSIIGGDTIIMNPPYSQADEHVRHAIRLVPENGGRVCALLRWNWITAIKRRDLLKHLHSAIIVGRLKMLPPGVPDKGHSGTVDFAWFVFTSHTTINTEYALSKIVRA